MKIVIRLDDITPGMDMGNFRRFKRLLDEHNIQPLIGVVPENKDPKLNNQYDDRVEDRRQRNEAVEVERRHGDRRAAFDDDMTEENPGFWRMVRGLQTEGWIISMHGLNHVYTTKKGGLLPLNKQSEFAGLSFEEQRDMISRGKKILGSHGIATDFFMAPSHTYDKNTIEALLENGFRRVTDGFGRAAYRRLDMTFYPISYRKESTRNDKREGYTTFVVHTNTLTNDDFQYYSDLFDEGNVVSWNEWLMEEPVEAGALQGLKEYLMARFKYILVHKRW